MTARVRALLREIDELVRPAGEDGAEPSPPELGPPDDQLAL